MDRIGPTFFEEENRVKNLVVRAISGAVLVALVVLSILLSSCYCFGVLFFAVMMLSLVEFYKMAEKIEGVSVDKWMGLAGGVVLYAAAFFVSFLGKSVTLFSVYALYVSVLMAFELFRGKQSPIQNLSATLLGHLYVSVPFVLFCLVEGATQQSKYLLLAFFVIIWASDTGAYLVGRFFGRHKMFERISPKKTWEGFAGGLIFAMVSGYIFHRLAVVDTLELAFWLALSAGVFVFGVLGDLVESMFKRCVGVKDSGNLIPGHGGFLDRFDSALLAAPVLYLLFSWVVYL